MLCSPDDLTLAHSLADQADALTLSRFRAHDLVVEKKPDLTEVSDADKSVELGLRSILRRERPSDGVIGEEFAQTSGSGRTWIIDPIDGTKNYVRGVPVWATLIALRDDSGIGLGLVSAPALGRRWWALRGHGAWTRESFLNTGVARQIRVSGVSEISHASVSTSDPTGWNKESKDALEEIAWRNRAYGDFWSHCLVAEGAVDIAAEPELALYDYAALIPILMESGGMATQFDGHPLPVFDAQANPSFLTTNAKLHVFVTELLNP